MKILQYTLITITVLAVIYAIVMVTGAGKKRATNNENGIVEGDSNINDTNENGTTERVGYLGAFSTSLFSKDCIQGATCRTASGVIGSQSHTATGCRCQPLQTTILN